MMEAIISCVKRFRKVSFQFFGRGSKKEQKGKYKS
jgi:hypothetical protein